MRLEKTSLGGGVNRIKALVTRKLIGGGPWRLAQEVGLECDTGVKGGELKTYRSGRKKNGKALPE